MPEFTDRRLDAVGNPKIPQPVSLQGYQPSVMDDPHAGLNRKQRLEKLRKYREDHSPTYIEDA